MMRGEKRERSRRLPNRYFKIGEIFNLDGVAYKVVERGDVPSPKMACYGCDLRHKACERLQCSRPDRIDGKNVWFQKIEE